jgi:beta-phosphoglucomutase-like phosphatase (HAD superfamily)
VSGGRPTARVSGMDPSVAKPGRVALSLDRLQAVVFEVDGVEADRLGLAGKPDPALFLEAARRGGR